MALYDRAESAIADALALASIEKARQQQLAHAQRLHRALLSGAWLNKHGAEVALADMSGDYIARCKALVRRWLDSVPDGDDEVAQPLAGCLQVLDEALV